MDENTALPQSTTNARVGNKICYFHMNLFTTDGIKKTQKKNVQNVTSILNCLKITCCCCCLSVPCRQLLFRHCGPPRSFLLFPPTGWCNSWPTTDNHDTHASMETDQLPDRVHPTGSETKYQVFNNQITDNVDIYHSEATTLKPKVCTMKYTKT